MRKTQNKKNTIMRYSIIALLVIFLVSGALMLLEVWEKNHGRFFGVSTGEIFVEYNGEKYVLKDNIETFLIIGLDKFEDISVSDSYNNDKQADFLMLFVFDNDSKKCTAIHINRDTMANVNILGLGGTKIDTVLKQIALAHTYGSGKEVSCRNTKDSVEDILLGMKVDHYISFTMDSVTIMNDLVGGVEVTVLDDFTGIDDTLIKGETVTLMGEHALNYVRTRYGLEDSSNSARMERQQQYINALYDKTISCIEADEEFVVKVADKMKPYVVYDTTEFRLQEFARKFDEYEFIGIRNIEGESKLGEEFIEFYPNADSVQKIVIELFYKLKD